jgi:hypothetical protein
LVPAGTGMSRYRSIEVEVEDAAAEPLEKDALAP